MKKGSLQIHSENILPIIKKWLYSDRDIFVRELISNACDALSKVKILRDRGEITAQDSDFRIDVKIDKDKGTLEFSDTGIGMNAEEVEKYIAQIAFSGAEEFLSKYKTNNESDQVIGHFGLGFYAAYMVADLVTIDTLSFKEGSEPVFWKCDGSSEYEMEIGKRNTRGTTVTLFINKEHNECLEATYIEKIIRHYCSYLPYPIYLDGKRMNESVPLWIKSPSECTSDDYHKFYHSLYPLDEDPLFWIHLNVDYPFTLKGILYFPKIRKDFDPSKSSITLYCNRVYVSDNCKDIIPNYLTALRGIIDSPDIPLNVSRSYLQTDKNVRQLSNHISKKVSDCLSSLYKTDRERFIKSWQDLSIIVKLASIEDEKFYERAKDFLIWRTHQGEWITLHEYLEKNKEKTKDKIFYTSNEKSNTALLQMTQDKGIDVIIADGPLDNYLIHFLEDKLRPVSFQRIDSEVGEHLIDKEREKIILDPEGKTQSAHLADFVHSKLNDEGIIVEAKSLHSDILPGFIVIDERQRRMRDYMMRMNREENIKSHDLLGKMTFVVNTNNALIESIQKLDKKNPELAKELIREVYEIALLSQHEMDPSSLHEFISRTNRILETLTSEALKS